MRSRWPIPAVALAVLFCSSRLGFAYSAQLRASEREQKILRIQRLIQEHDLEKAHLELAEAAKEFPTDEGFDNLLGIVEAQQGDYIAAEKSFRRDVIALLRLDDAKQVVKSLVRRKLFSSL